MLKKKVEIIKCINPFISSLLNEAMYEVRWVDPFSLFTSDRVDILVKYLYAKSLIDNDDNKFLRDLYLSNIGVFNGFVEGDYSGKVGKTSYLNSFEGLLNEISTNGYDDNSIIPLNRDNIPFDGAHRVAIAMALNMKVPVITVPSASEVHCTFEYFQKRGQKPFELDYLVTQYARIVPNTYMVLVWPAAIGRDEEIEAILSDNGIIAYKKTVSLTKNGLVNLQRVVYKNEPWVGGYYNDFNGVHMKAHHCYAPDSPLRVYLYESKSDNVYTKQLIRDLFGIGHHSIHINDRQEETVEIADLLFNNNAITYLNGATRRETKKFDELESVFKSQIYQYNVDQFAIIGGVIPLFGFRDARDLDYITTGNFQLTLPSNIEKEGEKTNYTKQSVDVIINDPRCHFKVDGLKFVSLDIIKEIKSKRNNRNDKLDLVFIKSVSGNHLSIIEKIRSFSLHSYYWKNKRDLRLKMRYLYYKWLK